MLTAGVMRLMTNETMTSEERRAALQNAIGNESCLRVRVRAGQDTTKIFKDYGHGDDAKKIRAKYQIGVLDGVRSPAPRCHYTRNKLDPHHVISIDYLISQSPCDL